jgi:hypothetical protein
MIQPGKYKANIKTYAIRPVKTGAHAGEPAPTIAFIVGTDTVFWQGSFNEGKARTFALDALFHCGLTSISSLRLLADGPEGGALDMTREVEIDVVHETGSNGQVYARVSWVNPVGGSRFMNTMGREDFQFFVGQMGLEADFLNIAKKYGVDVTAPKATDNGIPF